MAPHHCWNRAGENARHCQRAEGNRKGQGVRRHLHVVRQGHRRQRQQRIEERWAGQGPERAAGNHEDDSLDKQLGHELTRASPKRSANGQLATPVEHACQKQAADVDGGNDEAGSPTREATCRRHDGARHASFLPWARFAPEGVRRCPETVRPVSNRCSPLPPLPAPWWRRSSPSRLPRRSAPSDSSARLAARSVRWE